MEKMNKYKLERLALEDAFARRMLLDYDIREVTTQRQAKNGTREYQFPVTCWTKQVIKWNNGRKPTEENLRIAVFKSGYVRKQNGAWSPYQLNPVYKQNQRWMYIRDGELYTSKWVGQARAKIGSQLARMNYMLKYYLNNYAK